jgi:hypothetical protein
LDALRTVKLSCFGVQHGAGRDALRLPVPTSTPTDRGRRHEGAADQKYRRIAARRGPKVALVAIEHAILVAIWTMAHTGPT